MFQPISRVNTSRPAIAITFDDGPHEPNTLKFLELFGKEGVKATFFELGKKIKEHPGLIEKVHAAGHEIGNHSFTHPHLPQLTSEEILTQLQDTQDLIHESIGFTPLVFRAPYLDQDEKVWAILEEMGLPSINASQSARDWEESVTVEQIISRSTDTAVAGDILVLHTWSVKSLEAMPEIIRRYKAKGLDCVTVSELLALRST